MAEQGVWIIRTNQELGQPYKELAIVADIKKKDWKGWTCGKNGSGKDS